VSVIVECQPGNKPSSVVISGPDPSGNLPLGALRWDVVVDSIECAMGRLFCVIADECLVLLKLLVLVVPPLKCAFCNC